MTGRGSRTTPVRRLGDPWTLLALPALPQAGLQALLGDLPIVVTVPEERQERAVVRAIERVDLVLGDWNAELRITADIVAAAKRLCFVQQPSAGIDGPDLDPP